MGFVAVLAAVALLVILLQVVPWPFAFGVGLVLIAVLVDRIFSGPDRRLMRKMRILLRDEERFDGLLLACLPVEVTGLEHPPRTSQCSGCRAESALEKLTGVRKLVATVTTGSVSFWSTRGREIELVARYPYREIRGLKQLEGAFSLLAMFRRQPLDPDRLPLKNGSRHKLLLSFDDFSSVYLEARVRWDATMFHEAYGVVAGNLTLQALTLLSIKNDVTAATLTETLGSKHVAVTRELVKRRLADSAKTDSGEVLKLTPDGAYELVQQWVQISRNLRFTDPMESPALYPE
jgi:hypothetical protein